ncbi:hypothetical protein H5410_007124 [Solanum commersonii]|uniref:Uncharacterized protein n=1 Tax=Solanum commersonii TaxID=4109 RepID=A0A9J6ACK7_SOLCO|nr:hypothetical protein H5410_007124 [Solanum commersonii]
MQNLSLGFNMGTNIIKCLKSLGQEMPCVSAPVTPLPIQVVDLFVHHLNQLISHVIQPNLNHVLASRPVQSISSSIGSTRIDDQGLT